MPDGPQAVILAAGQGTRMRSAAPKVLHQIGGRALIDHVIDLADQVCEVPAVVIVSSQQPQVREHVAGRAQVAEQVAHLGTGDAVRSVPKEMRSAGTILILNADVPLLKAATVRRLLEAQRGRAGAILTVVDHGRNGLGRVSRNAAGDVETIVEEADLVPGSMVSEECNAGVYAFDGTLLWPALERLVAGNAQGEYYITDLVTLIEGRVAAVEVDDPSEALGINDRRQLAVAEAALRHRTLDRLMLAGVTIEDPSTTYVDSQVEIGQDSVIRPMTALRGRTHLGPGCEIGPFAQLSDVRGGARVKIGASALDDCQLGDDVTIGHFDRVRPNTTLDSGVSLGTHAEVKNSTVGAGSHISHFSCVLDSDLGRDVTIGAGTVTCNYDGAAKQRTRIADGVFVGSNSTLVAPLNIAAEAYVAAGSLVNQDVPAGALAVGRARQRNVEGWRARQSQRPVPGAANGADS